MTNRMKMAHNISKTTTNKEFMKFSTNIESDNNDTNIEIDKLELENSFMLEHAKEQELINKDSGLEIILGMKSTVHFDNSI